MGFGFIFIYGSTQFVSKIVITTPGGVVDYIREFIKIGDFAALIGGIVTFMKERNRAEEALQESENKLKAAFEGTHDAITITEKGVLVDCNKRVLELFGLNSTEEFRKVRPADFSPPLQPDGSRSWKKSREHIQKALSERVNSFEWVHQRKDGGTFPAEIHLTAYTLGGETVLQANIRDISERKAAETEIAKFKTISDQAIHGSAIADLDGNLIYINDYFARIHGYTPAQLMGENLVIFHNENQQHEVKLLTESLKKKGTLPQRKYGTPIRMAHHFPC